MSRYKMPKKRQDFEDILVLAFDIGMQCGYGVEHTEKSDDERIYRNRYRALIQGKISSMDECLNGEKTFVERMAGL